MSQAIVEFQLGAETVTSVLDIDLGGETIITGDFGGLVPAGTTARLRGNINLTGNMHVRGTLLCDPSGVNLNGNGFDIHTHDGTLNLQGVEKSAWVYWGDTPVGWQVGDRLSVAPMARSKILALPELSWSGSWASMTRPVDAPDVTIFGVTHKPEVVNLSQTVTLRNLQRIMIHEASGPNPQTFKWIRVLDSGQKSVLGMYPIHFHMIGEHARGSILEGVVVENGKNHAFVPHASHGITYKGCVAYKTTDVPYWWDPAPVDDDMNPINDTDDVVWDRCLAMFVLPSGTGDTVRMTAFALGSGERNTCIDSAAVGMGRVAGINDKNSSGFRWLENNVWTFDRCKAHNNRRNGIFVWTQSPNVHPLENFTAFHNLRSPVEHGAYINSFQYQGGVFFTGNKVASGSDETAAVFQHAMSRGVPGSGLLFEDIKTDDRLLVLEHSVKPAVFVTHRRCTYSNVVYREGNQEPSLIRYEDCGFTPARFDLGVSQAGIRPASIIEIYESGSLTFRWANGVWT